MTVRTFGLATLGWPRGEVVARTARYVAGVVFDHWVTPNFGRARDRVPGWAAEQLARLQLDPDGLVDRLRAAADRAVGQPVGPCLARALDPLVPRGWRPKPPDPLQVTLAFAHLDKLIVDFQRGTPTGGAPITITGHASTTGDGGHNQRLSERRANAVANYLRTHGDKIAGSRITVVGAGADGAGPGVTYLVDVPGGRLSVTERADGHLELTGPAVLVATGQVDL